MVNTRAIHVLLVDDEVWYCPHCGQKIDIEKYDKEKFWVCIGCGRKCFCDEQYYPEYDEIIYEESWRRYA